MNAAIPSFESSLAQRSRSEEHTSELQSQSNLVCRLLLEKKKKNVRNTLLRADFGPPSLEPIARRWTIHERLPHPISVSSVSVYAHRSGVSRHRKTTRHIT